MLKYPPVSLYPGRFCLLSTDSVFLLNNPGSDFQHLLADNFTFYIYNWYQDLSCQHWHRYDTKTRWKGFKCYHNVLCKWFFCKAREQNTNICLYLQWLLVSFVIVRIMYYATYLVFFCEVADRSKWWHFHTSAKDKQQCKWLISGKTTYRKQPSLKQNTGLRGLVSSSIIWIEAFDRLMHPNQPADQPTYLF